MIQGHEVQRPTAEVEMHPQLGQELWRLGWIPASVCYSICGAVCFAGSPRIWEKGKTRLRGAHQQDADANRAFGFHSIAEALGRRVMHARGGIIVSLVSRSTRMADVGVSRVLKDETAA